MKNRMLFNLAILLAITALLISVGKAQEISKSVGDNVMAASKTLRTDYFIDVTDPVADDGNPGTEVKPFKTIEGCFKVIAKKLKPGDNVWIKDGEYRGVSLRLGKRGIAIPDGESYSRMISIMAYPGHKPVINQSSLVKSWKPFKDKIWVASYQDSKRVFPVTFVDGKLLQQIGGTVRNSPNYWKGKKGETIEDMEPGSFFFDEKAKKLFVWLEDGGDPNERKMEAYGTGDPDRYNCFIIGGKYLKVSGLTIRYGGISIGGSHCLLENIDQSWSGFGGCGIYGEFNTIVNSKFNHNGNNGMGGRGRGHRIIDCETSYNNYRNWSNGWHSGGVKFIPQCHDWVLKGHISSYNNGDGIWFDWGMSNVTIEGCRSFRNKAAGIHYEIGTRGVIKNNLCYENGARGIYLSNASYCLVTNNLCYRNAMSGITSIGVKRSQGPTVNRGTGIMPGGHNVFMGNILMDNCDAVGLLGLYDAWPLSPNFKKIFAAYYEKFKGWGDRPELIVPDPRGEPANEGTYSDYNIFYRSGKRGENPKELAFAYNWDIEFARGLEDWRKKSGLDKHSIFAEPKFKDLAAYDFHPTPDSPAQWFMKQYDIGIKYDFEGPSRSYKNPAYTAGPYTGDQELLKKLKTEPVGKYSMFPFVVKAPLWNDGRAVIGGLMKDLGVKDVAKFQRGITVAGIPFSDPSKPSSQMYFSELNSQKWTLKLNKQVKALYFLFSAEVSDQPFVRCTMHRDDGVKITFDWKSDGKAGFTTVPVKNLSTKMVWSGTCTLRTKEGKRQVERSAFITTWKNENEWLPISKIDFEHIAPASNFALFGVTGENLK